MNNRSLLTRRLAQGALIAAIYVVLTFVFAPISFGAMQVRIAEILTILPLFTPAAIPGLFIGCLVSNLLGGGAPLDVIFGSIATLLGAFLTYKIGYKRPEISSPKYWLAMACPVISNMLITGTVVWYCYGFSGFGVAENHAFGFLPLTMLTVGIGEALAVFGLGTLLYLALRRLPDNVLN